VFVSIDKATQGAGRPLNTIFTFTLVGFWHGASWNFVVFGFLHGVYLVLYGLWTKLVPRRPRGPLPAILGNLVTMVSLGVSLVLFRCPTWEQAMAMLGIAFGLRAPGADAISIWWFVLLLVCLAVHWLNYRNEDRRPLARVPDWAYALGYGAAWALVVPWAAGYKPFIYFQF
jgi:D-alanyl-lipoteichoic acid acyltransferase DltB (MBOAT superfamily)